jgi:hypothetical protein
VLVARARAAAPGDQTDRADLDRLLQGLPRVSGAWGGGRLLSGSLFSVLLTEDGRILAGAVSPQRLYEAAADPAAALKGGK